MIMVPLGWLKIGQGAQSGERFFPTKLLGRLWSCHGLLVKIHLKFVILRIVAELGVTPFRTAPVKCWEVTLLPWQHWPRHALRTYAVTMAKLTQSRAENLRCYHGNTILLLIICLTETSKRRDFHKRIILSHIMLSGLKNTSKLKNVGRYFE